MIGKIAGILQILSPKMLQLHDMSFKMIKQFLSNTYEFENKLNNSEFFDLQLNVQAGLCWTPFSTAQIMPPVA